MKRAGLLLFLTACSGGPIREKPLFEPPPVPEAGSAAAPEIVGAWTSIGLKGPGSASFRRIDLVFHRDGRFAGIAEGSAKVEVLSGRCALADGTLRMTPDQGEALPFGVRFDGATLILADHGAELHLIPLRE